MKSALTRLLIAALFVVGVSQANALTLSLVDLGGFSQIAATDPGTITVNNGLIPAGTAVTLTTIFSPPQTGLQGARVGLTGLSTAYNAGDSMNLFLKNTNENAWSFDLTVLTSNGLASSGSVALIPDTGGLFTANLGGVAGTITDVYFIISGNVPFPDGDRTAEYEISPQRAVPEPATLTLLGLGLAGAGALKRRRRPRL